MKVKIIKEYKIREGRVWSTELIVDVTNDFGRELIKGGFAHEIRFEKRRDSKGHEYEIQIEVLDNKGTTISKQVKVKE